MTTVPMLVISTNIADRTPEARWNWNAWSIATGLVVVLCVLAAGCPSTTDRSCTVDDDCRSDEICVERRCARTCTDDGDCRTQGFICRPYLEEDSGRQEEICRPSDAGPGTRYRCTDDRDCRDLDVGPAVCGINGRCIVVDRRRAIRISNPTSNRDGPEIAAAYLVGADDEIVAYGNTIEYCPYRRRETSDADASDTVDGAETSVTDTTDNPSDTMVSSDTGPDTGDTAAIDGREAGIADGNGDTSDGTDTSIPSCRSTGSIDGSPVTLNDTKTCTDGSRAQAMTLGPHGDIYLEFLSESGRRVDLDGIFDVVVIEWGANCGGGPEDSEPYEISLCTTTARSFSASDCRPVQSGTDKQRVTIEPG